MKEKVIYVCPNCGSEDIEQVEWRNINTSEFCGATEDECWCNDCDCNFQYYLSKEEYELKKVKVIETNIED